MPYHKSIGVEKETKNRFDKIYLRVKIELKDRDENITMSEFLDVLMSYWEDGDDKKDYLMKER